MATPSPDDGTGFRVLVADDSAAIRDLLCEALGWIGCAVTCVEDGLQALATLQAEPYDLLITDYQMPRLDGLALLRRLQASNGVLPTVLISAHCSPDLIEGARQAGVTTVLPKPFAIPDLLSLVESFKHQRPARS